MMLKEAMWWGMVCGEVEGAGLRAGAMPTACCTAGAQVGRGSAEEISLVGEIVTAACLCFMHKVSLCFIYTLGDLERPIS